MERTRLTGHLLALMTIIIWGTTFISTKVLLRDFTPVEILFFRFTLGLVALMLVYPRRLRLTDPRQEWLFALAGLCGVTLYFLLENIALTYTFASNVGVLVGVSPFLTGLLAFRFLAAERPGLNFFVGFAVAITGIGLISYNANAVLRLNPLGDVLALLAAGTWACYSVVTRKISTFGYHSLPVTRRIFFYGLLLMLPSLFIFDFSWDLSRFARPINLANMLFLGLGASALCFVSWSFSLKALGAVKTSVYIYLVPVVTVLTAALILQEPITLLAGMGTGLTLLGLAISETQRFHVGRRARAVAHKD